MTNPRNPFSGRKAVSEKLLRYGFRKEGTLYRYETDIDEEFFLCLEVFSPYESRLSILDKELKEEYIPYFSYMEKTDFLLSLENRVNRILDKIGDSCYERSYLPCFQGDRVVSLLVGKYQDKVDEKENAIRLRREDNNKVYLSIFQKPKDNLFYAFFHGDDNDIDNEFLFPPFLRERKFNIAVPLDGRVPDANLVSMLCYSRELNK